MKTVPYYVTQACRCGTQWSLGQHSAAGPKIVDAHMHADALNLEQNIFQRLRHELLRTLSFFFFVI